MNRYTLVFLSLLFTQPTFSQDSERPWIILPVLASSTETGFQLGAFAAYFPPAKENKPSSLSAAAVGSFKGQYQIAFAPDVYFKQNRYHLEGFITWRKWPSNFYGLGNNTPDTSSEFEAQGFESLLTIQRRFGEHIFIGPYYRLFWEDVTFQNSTAQNALIGATGQRASGIGIWAAYDTRDNPNAPRTGTFLRYAGRIFRAYLGSELDYSLQTYEARQYIPVGANSVVAFSSYLRITDGSTPFRDLSTPDGIYTFRGIKKGRYRDRHLLTLQSEYRFPIHKKIGLALFAEAAQVVSKLGDLSANQFKSSLGGGFRYALNQEQRFNLRVDTNWVDGAFGLTINVKEAF